MDDWMLLPVACPSNDRVTDSGPPISGVAAVSLAFFSVNDMAPWGPASTEVNSTWVSLMNLDSNAVSYILPDKEDVLAARLRYTNATEVLPSSNWAEVALSLVIVKLSISCNLAVPSNAATSTLENG